MNISRQIPAVMRLAVHSRGGCRKHCRRAAGAVTGNIGKGAGIGGAAGAAGGLVGNIKIIEKPSQVYKNFVSRCLREKGYEP